MRFVLVIVLCVQGWLGAIQTDFDVAVVGSSPVSLLEAVYHMASREKVLVLEADKNCGGAWKSIDICGIAHADLGCHLIGNDRRLKEFLEKYFGCRFVCLEHPTQEANHNHLTCSNGYYFSRGCHELITCLEARISSYPNGTILKKQLLSIFIDPPREQIELNLGDCKYTTKKLIVTNASAFRVDNPMFSNFIPSKHAYNHLYILVKDSTPVRFTYLNGIAPGMSRAMNLTPFLQMPVANCQLIAIQTHGKTEMYEAQKFLEAFIAKGQLGKEARILKAESYNYDQLSMNVTNIQKFGGTMIEIIDGSSFSGMVRYLDKWKGALTPLK